jgi:nucleotide-binding universal stress UspA family protein
MTMRAVMVALDGSDKDERAIAVATAIARLSEGSVHLVGVVMDPWDVVEPSRQAPNMVATDRGEVDARLAELAARLSTSTGREVTSAVLPARDVPAALCRHAVERDALLIVLATRAAGAGDRAMAGSVADSVMQDSERPVVLVPPGAAFMSGKELTISRVLVPLENSSLAYRSIEFVMDLPRAADVAYILVEIIEDESGRASATTHLEGTAAWLRSRGAKAVEIHVIRAADAAEAILGVVRDVLADAIVMSTRGAGGLARMVLGSVAEGVVRGSELPVMLLTPRMLAGKFEDFKARLRQPERDR